LGRKCHGLLWPSLSCLAPIVYIIVKPTSSEDQALTHLHSCLSRLLHFHANRIPSQDVNDPSQILRRTPDPALKTKRDRIKTSHHRWENGITETPRGRKLERAFSNVKTRQRSEAPSHCPASHSRPPFIPSRPRRAYTLRLSEPSKHPSMTHSNFLLHHWVWNSIFFYTRGSSFYMKAATRTPKPSTPA
jgi:hypothetical protein